MDVLEQPEPLLVGVADEPARPDPNDPAERAAFEAFCVRNVDAAIKRGEWWGRKYEPAGAPKRIKVDHDSAAGKDEWNTPKGFLHDEFVSAAYTEGLQKAWKYQHTWKGTEEALVKKHVDWACGAVVKKEYKRDDGTLGGRRAPNVKDEDGNCTPAAELVTDPTDTNQLNMAVGREAYDFAWSRLTPDEREFITRLRFAGEISKRKAGQALVDTAEFDIESCATLARELGRSERFVQKRLKQATERFTALLGIYERGGENSCSDFPDD